MSTKKGITLIALVITIIVLLILAGVTIQMIVGKNGIVNRAINASEETTDADIEEILRMAVSGVEGDFIGLWNEDNTLVFLDCIVDDEDELDVEEGEDPKVLLKIKGYEVKLGDGPEKDSVYDENAETPREIKDCKIQKLDKDGNKIGAEYSFNLVEKSVYGADVEDFARVIKK